MNISTNIGGQSVNLSAAFPVLTTGGSPSRLTQAQLQQQLAQNPSDQASQYLLSHFDALAKASHKDPLNHFSFDLPVNSPGVPLPDDDNSVDQNELAYVAGLTGGKDEIDDADLAALAQAPEVTQKQDQIPTPTPIDNAGVLTFDEVYYNDNDGMDVPKKVTTVDVAPEFNTKLDINHDGSLDKTELDAAAGGISIPEQHDNTLGKFLSQNRDKFSGPITLDAIAKVAGNNDPTKLEQADLGTGNDILPLPDPIVDPGVGKGLKFRLENGMQDPGFGFFPGPTVDAEPALKKIDTDGDGNYTKAELTAFTNAGKSPYFQTGYFNMDNQLATFMATHYDEIAGKDGVMSYDELRNRAGADGTLSESDIAPAFTINPIKLPPHQPIALPAPINGPGIFPPSKRSPNDGIAQLVQLLQPLIDYLRQYMGSQGNMPINSPINPVISPDFILNQGTTDPQPNF